MLHRAGCLRGSEVLHHDCAPPASSTREGCYADDHVVVQRLTCMQLRDGEPLRDTEIVEESVFLFFEIRPFEELLD